MTRAEWKEEVLKFLESISGNYYFDRSKAAKLIEENNELDRIAEQKRKSNEKRKLMQKVNGTETVKVNKAKNEELKTLLAKAMQCIE